MKELEEIEHNEQEIWIKKGDSVFRFGWKGWIIYTHKIIEAKSSNNDDIKLTLDNDDWSGYYLKNKISASNTIWADKRAIIRFVLEIAERGTVYQEVLMTWFLNTIR